ncbi:uncharacterized protein ACBT44_004789 [Syngnathus typhle]
MMTLNIDVIVVLMAFFSASFVLSDDIQLKSIQEATENACFLPSPQLTLMVQKPSTTRCLKSFFCEAEKTLKNSFSKSRGMVQKPNMATCQKSSFCKAEKGVNKTTGEELKILARNLHQYNKKNGVETCHLRNNAKYPLCKLLEDIAKCALQQLF